MSQPPSIKAMVQAVPRSLGSYGPVLEEIEAALQSPACNLNSIGDAIQKDPDLTARLLRLANSPFFGFANRPGETKKVFLSQNEDIFIAGEGDIVDRRYRVLRISPTAVDVEDVLNNNRQSLPLLQGPPG